MTASTVERTIGQAVEVLPAEVERDCWLRARSGGLGASEIAAVLGLSPYTSPFDLFWRKVRGDEQPDREQLRWGRRLEAAVADEFAERHPEFEVEPCGLLAHAERPWQRCSPDRLLYESVGDPPDGEPLPRWEHELLRGEPLSVLEVKTHGTLEGWGDHGSDEVPVHYRCQVLWQLDVLGLTEGWLALLVSGRTYREYPITHDETDLAIMRAAGEEFWRSVEAARRDPDNAHAYAPDVDAHLATTGRLKRLFPDAEDIEVDVDATLAFDYLTACEAIRDLEQVKAEAGNRLLAAIGDAKWAYVNTGGQRRKVATRSVSRPKRLDTTALRADHPELAASYTREADEPQVRLLPALPKQAKTIKDV